MTTRQAETLTGESPDPAPPIERRWLPAVVPAAGLLTLLVLVVAYRLQEQAGAEDAALLAAVGELRIHAAISHLWLEEHVSGDDVDLGEVDRRLDRARHLLEAMCGERRLDEPAQLPPIGGDEPELASLLAAVAAGQQAFAQIARDRRLGYERRLDVGIGSDFDVEFDRVFGRLIGDLDTLEDALVARRAQRREAVDGSTAALVGMWAVVLGVATWGLWTDARKRRHSAAALEASRRQLHRAQRADAVGQVASGLAHDLHNLLAAVRSQCELAARHGGEEGAGRLRLALDAVDRASDLLDRLLTFARPGGNPLQPVDLGHLLSDAQPLLAAALGARIELEMSIAAGLWPVVGDARELDQVVVNLVMNARDALPHGGRIRVVAENVARRDLPTAVADLAGDAVRLSVSDNGAGIARAELERIFLPFVSIRRGSDGGEAPQGRPRGGHSGLGLAIVDAATRRAGGRVAVASEVGAGTTFDIYLRRAPPGSLGAPPPARELEPAPARRRS